MMQRFEYVVIGAGPAGGAAAVELTRGAPTRSVALVGAEQYAPYERPPLSKAVLTSDPANEGPRCLFGDVDSLASTGVTPFIPARAASIDRAEGLVCLESGQVIAYDKLLLATGTSARRLDVPGAALAGIHYLRTYDDARALSPELRPGRKLVVVGGGFIGLEVASTACRAGCGVTVIEAGPWLMGRAAPTTVAIRVLEKFRSEGVEIRLNESVAKLHGDSRVTSVLLGSGARLNADIVLVGIGAVPNDALARAAGLEVANGIVTDLDGRTSDPSVFAAGDVASRLQQLDGYPSWAKRLEAWEPALEQGVAAARAMLGEVVAPASAPWIWSDQFDWNLQFAGHGELADEVVERPGATPDVLTLFQLRHRRLVGMVTLNDARSMTLGRRAVLQSAVLDPVRLADPTLSIREALRPAALTPSVIPR